MSIEEAQLDQSNVYVNEIARLLLQNEDLDGDWDAAALSVILNGDSYDSSGFKYTSTGKAIPIAPSGWELYEKLIAYRDFQAEQSGDPVWKSCLIQIDRASNSFEIHVEYDNPMRWKITPKNLAQMRNSLRP